MNRYEKGIVLYLELWIEWRIEWLTIIEADQSSSAQGKWNCNKWPGNGVVQFIPYLSRTLSLLQLHFLIIDAENVSMPSV